MKILLFEPTRRRDPYFRHTINALLAHAGARWTDRPRPRPQIEQPRRHTSMWLECDGYPVCLDHNDHVFFYDIEALKHAAVYFKANLNWQVTDKVLRQHNLGYLRSKIMPYFFFASDPAWTARRRWFDPWREWSGPRRDVCHIVGINSNPLAQGVRSPFLDGRTDLAPWEYHFWIRWHVSEALKRSGLSGYFRLTSRGNRALEDCRVVFPNISENRFFAAIQDCRMTMVNTLPHAVLPWKVAESFAMRRPVILERSPLVEMPEPFALVEGRHFLALLPDVGGFDTTASLDDPRSYRVLAPPDPVLLQQRMEWLREMLHDRERVRFMQQEVDSYARRSLSGTAAAEYICRTVESLIK